MWMSDDAWTRPGAPNKGKRSGRNSYKNKSHQLEAIVREKLSCFTQLQNEQNFLEQKATVLELLVEVASEIATHKRQHTGIKFPELRDKQLASFLDNFLDSYGGYAAERPTARNVFELDKLDIQTFRDMSLQNFSQQYTAFVQRLSLLLQATDNSMMGGLSTCIHDLKQLLLGTLLWSPFIFLQVSSHHLVSGQALEADAEHSAACITNIELFPHQEDILVILGDLYNTQVSAMAAAHNHLGVQLDQELPKDGGSTAATIMQISTNMNKLLSCHQLFHVAIMNNLSDQQLALLCVRCFPRFPSFQDLLTALVHIRNQSQRELGQTTALPKAWQSSGSLVPETRAMDSCGKPKDKLTDAGNLSLPGFSTIMGSSFMVTGQGVKDGTQAHKPTAARDQGAQEAAEAEAAEHISGEMPSQPAGPVAASVHGVGKVEADSNPQQMDSLAAAAVAVLGSSDRCGKSTHRSSGGHDNGSSKGTDKHKDAPKQLAARGVGVGSSSSSRKASDKSKELSEVALWHQQQQAAGNDVLDGVQADLAEGLPLDPAIAAALPVDFSPLTVKRPQQGASPSSHQPAAAAGLMQQLRTLLSTPSPHANLLQLLTAHPDLALQLQQQSDLLKMVQDGVTAEQLQQQLLSACKLAGCASTGQQLRGHNSVSEPAQHAKPLANSTAASGLVSVGATTAALDAPAPGGTCRDDAGSSPLQTLLHAVASLWQNCSSVAEAAAATAASRQGEPAYVRDAILAAEAAVQATLKSLQEIKEKLNRPQCGYTPAMAAAGISGPAGPFPLRPFSTHVSAPKLQPHVGGPLPYTYTSHLQPPRWQAHDINVTEVLPQQSSHLQQSDTRLHSQLGVQQGRSHGQSHASPSWTTAQRHSGQRWVSSDGTAALDEQDQAGSGALSQQQPSGAAAAAAQLLQALQVLQEQDRTADAAALLNRLAAAVTPGNPGSDQAASPASLLRRLQHQAGQHAAVDTTHRCGIPAASPVPTLEGMQRGSSLKGPQTSQVQAHPTFHASVDHLPPPNMGRVVPTGSTDLSQRAQLGISQAAVLATAPSAAAAGPSKAEVKEDSPSAGSCITSTGQQQQQAGANGVYPPQGPAGLLAAHLQPDGARQALGAAAGPSSGMQQVTADADAFALLVTKLLKGQSSAEGGLSGATATATALQAMLTAQRPPQKEALAALLAAGPDVTTPGLDTRATAAAAAAAASAMMPPALAAAMTAKQAAVVGGPGAGSMHSDALDACAAKAAVDQMDVDAASALEMLASAAVSTGY